MKRILKLSLYLVVMILIFPSCLKNKNSGITCIITSAHQLKRKVLFNYASGAILTGILDYSDSTNILSLSTRNVFYNSYGQVSYVLENLENGLRDSVTFDYSTTSRIKQRKYIVTGNGMQLNEIRHFVLDANGYISSDTTYGNIPVKGVLIVYGFSTYDYDVDHNLTRYSNFYANGNPYFSLSYKYTDSLIKTSSYNIARFTVLEHYGDSYQYVFPQISRLPSDITLNYGETSLASYTYDLDANGNPVQEHYTSSVCSACAKTTYYVFQCR